MRLMTPDHNQICANITGDAADLHSGVGRKVVDGHFAGTCQSRCEVGIDPLTNGRYDFDHFRIGIVQVLEMIIERMKNMQSGTVSLRQPDGQINGVQTGRRKLQSDKDFSEHGILPTFRVHEKTRPRFWAPRRPVCKA